MYHYATYKAVEADKTSIDDLSANSLLFSFFLDEFKSAPGTHLTGVLPRIETICKELALNVLSADQQDTYHLLRGILYIACSEEEYDRTCGSDLISLETKYEKALHELDQVRSGLEEAISCVNETSAQDREQHQPEHFYGLNYDQRLLQRRLGQGIVATHRSQNQGLNITELYELKPVPTTPSLDLLDWGYKQYYTAFAHLMNGNLQAAEILFQFIEKEVTHQALCDDIHPRGIEWDNPEPIPVERRHYLPSKKLAPADGKPWLEFNLETRTRRFLTIIDLIKENYLTQEEGSAESHVLPWKINERVAEAAADLYQTMIPWEELQECA